MINRLTTIFITLISLISICSCQKEADCERLSVGYVNVTNTPDERTVLYVNLEVVDTLNPGEIVVVTKPAGSFQFEGRTLGSPSKKWSRHILINECETDSRSIAFVE